MKFAAHFVFTAKDPALPKAIVEVDSFGRILRVTETKNLLTEQAGMEFHNGVICPAFPNIFQYSEWEELVVLLPELQTFGKYLPANTDDPKVIFNWIKTIQINEPEITLQELIRLFAQKAAAVFDLKEAGTIETGKCPGLVLLSSMDYRNLRLNENSRLKKLI